MFLIRIRFWHRPWHGVFIIIDHHQSSQHVSCPWSRLLCSLMYTIFSVTLTNGFRISVFTYGQCFVRFKLCGYPRRKINYKIYDNRRRDISSIRVYRVNKVSQPQPITFPFGLTPEFTYSLDDLWCCILKMFNETFAISILDVYG